MEFEIILLLITQSMVFASCGLAVFLQCSQFRGFDLSFGAWTLVGAEVFIYSLSLFGAIPYWGLILSLIVVLLTCLGLSVLWNKISNKVWPINRSIQTEVFVASLGLLTACSGLVTLLRGPGLRQSSLDISGIELLGFPLPIALALILPGIPLILIMLVCRFGVGYPLILYSLSPQFAVEIGIERKMLWFVSGIFSGLLAASLGVFYALTDGSRPDLVMQPFLFGAASMLIPVSPSPFTVAISGALLGAAYMLLQLIVDPVTSRMVLFLGVALLIVIRKSDRFVEEAE